nr:RNA-directed DNA polymerase, eukaryota, reverse transcriptase zinc-binding domain protein [Tanacetum cinerariifolium]
MQEAHYDYGSIPFKFCHYWFELDGFDKLLEQTWLEANRREVVRLIQEVEKVDAMEVSQKAKINWSIEGAKNSKYYHGVLNKKRGRLTILGVLVDGIWMESPRLVKHEFFKHFKNRFEKPNKIRILLERDFVKRISLEQNENLEREVFDVEIKRAVWDCGIDKAPRLDGFTFGFYRRYWDIIGNDVVDAVKWFLLHGEIPQRGNSSFITLIPKVPNANMVKDFRSISLIGSLYKVIAKVLTNRLVTNIKKQSVIFKFDFEKVYDSIRWDFIDDILRRINMNKSNLMGISVDSNKVKYAAAKIGALKYGIYSCAFFNGADVNSKKSSWVRWKSVLAAKDVGGLGVVVKALHCEDGKIGKKVQPRLRFGCSGMKRGFLSQKCSRRGRGVKEKDLNGNKRNNTLGIGLSMKSDDTMNGDTPVAVAFAVNEGTTMTGNAPGKSSYANVTGKPSGKKLNFRTLFTLGNNALILKKWHPDENLMKEDINIVPVWVKLYGVHVTAFSEDGLSMSSYARAMIELRAYVDLKDNIIMAMPKLIGEGHYICNVRVEYEWKPPRYVSCKVFGHIHEECPKNTGIGEKKTLKKPSQPSRSVLVGPKIGFKPPKEYRLVPKKPTANSSGNKKKGVIPTIEVSNYNPFEVLNSIDNNVELGTNGGTTNLVNNEATSSGSSFMNVDNSSTRTTLTIDKIEKFEELLTNGKATLVDEAGNPLKMLEYPDDYDSEDEVALVDNDMARSMASERVGFGTQSLLEQWRDSYGNDDYDEDPYDDDMYEGQDLSQELQAIGDNLNIRVRGRKKK